MNFYLGITAFSSFGLFVFLLFIREVAMKDPIMWGTIAEWFGATGTITAVIVALFKDQLLGLYYRPIFRASIKHGQPDTRKTATVTPGNPIYSIRLRVENIGRSRAENVEVVINSLYKKSEAGYQLIESFAPMNLKWSNSQPNTVMTYLEGMSPTMGRHCDFAYIAFKDSKKLVFSTEINPSGEWNFQESGEYQVQLKIGAANCKSIGVDVFIKYTGVWKDEEVEMLGKELVISMR